MESVDGERHQHHKPLRIEVRVTDRPGDPHLVGGLDHVLQLGLGEAAERSAVGIGEELQQRQRRQEHPSSEHYPDDLAQSGRRLQQKPDDHGDRSILDEAGQSAQPDVEIRGREQAENGDCGECTDGDKCANPSAEPLLGADIANNQGEQNQCQQWGEGRWGSVVLGRHTRQTQDGEGSNGDRSHAGLFDDGDHADEAEETGHSDEGVEDHGGDRPDKSDDGYADRQGGVGVPTAPECGGHPALWKRLCSSIEVTAGS